MPQKVVLWVILYLATIKISGQQAPEIQVVDSDGISHDLYDDYLNQGATVMIHIFFSSCPPCQSIAGQLEDLYQEWGAGDHDVQFIGLSNQEWETDETVNNFRSTLDVTSPCVSSDGGSLPAVDALVNGGYGDYFGAPLYLVVSPEGAVRWDIFGFGDAATIDSIDAALKETGATKPTSGILDIDITPIRVTPNPAGTQIKVLDLPAHSESLAFVLSQVNGKLVCSGILPPHGFINLEGCGLSVGTYIVVIHDKRRVAGVQRVVVVK